VHIRVIRGFHSRIQDQGCGFVIGDVHEAQGRYLHRRGRGGVAQVSKPVRPAAILAAVPDVAGRTAKIAICRTALESGATPLAARSSSAGNRDAFISILLPSSDGGQSTTAGAVTARRFALGNPSFALG
jgi:hypothetical protein